MGFLHNSILTNVFIIIIQSDKYCFVHTCKTVDGVTKSKDKRKFFFEKSTKTPSIMIDYIYSFSKKYSATYVATILDGGFQQIAIYKEISRQAAVNIKDNNVSIFVNDQWQVYCGTQEVNIIKEDFRSLSLDYIFSPYSILYFLYEQFEKHSNSLYLLSTPSFIAMIIFQDSLAVSYANIYLGKQDNYDEEHDLDDLDIMENEFDTSSDMDDLELDLDLSDDDDGGEKVFREETDDEKNEEDVLQQEIVKNIEQVITSFYDSKYYRKDDDIINNIILFNESIFDSKIKSEIKNATMFEISSKEIKLEDTITSIMHKSLRE